MSRLTQVQVFQAIREKAKRKQEEGTDFASGVITKLLRKQYDPNLEGPLYFYSQDKHGLPIARVPTYVAGRKHYCSVGLENVFSVEDWQGQSKPANFIGKVWPPRVIEHLLGDVDKTEYIVKECYVCNQAEDDFCKCGYKSWRDYCPDYWPTYLLLQRAGARGHGIFARKVIQDSTIVGEYTGRIKPAKTNEASEEDAYHTSISIGGCNARPELQTTAALNALHTGSVLRFLNHSCDSNARLQEFQCGLERRVLYAITTREIAIGEELTIDYGSGWLNSDRLCGNANCRNPPKDPKELDVPVGDLSEDETADVDEDESLVVDVSDSSEDEVEAITVEGADVDSDTEDWDVGYRSSDSEYEDDTDNEEHPKKKRRTYKYKSNAKT